MVHDIVSDCITFANNELGPARAKATDYYLGHKFGNEEDGRSQVVLTSVRDGVLGVLPSLLRVVFGPDRVVEFVPHTASQVDQAAQATDYVQFVFAEDNAGFLKTHSVLKDGLVRKMGIFKWGWDESRSSSAYRLTNVTESELEILAADDDVTLVKAEQNEAEAPSPYDAAPGSPDGAVSEPGQALASIPSPGSPDGQPELTYTVEIIYHERDGRACVWTVPPDEFLVSREARSIDTALFVGHQMDKTLGELTALGIDKDDIDEHGTSSSALRDGVENAVRQPNDVGTSPDPDGGEANEKTLFVEGYARIDVDGDGIAELRLIWAIGPNHHIVKNIPTDEAPFSVFCPDPEPHTLIGQSWADRLMDLQLVTSSITRSTLDSLAASIYPRTEYVEGQVSVEDVMNTAIGAPIRTRAPGMINSFKHQFVGSDSLPMLAYFDEVSERRTGQNKGAVGLDADALQSSSPTAVGAAVTSSQAQTELLARIFTETALKPLFRGLLKLLVKYQPRERMVRLRGEWAAVDPRVWDSDMDVSVNVALGSGLVEEKVATLLGVAAKQELILSTLGPENPICTLAQYSHTLKRIAELQGYKNSNEFFNDVDPNWKAPQQEPPPDPATQMAQAALQVEQMKNERMLAIKESELELKRTTLLMNHERETANDAAQHELARYELELKYHAQISTAQLTSDMAREQHAVDTHVALQQQGHDQAIATHKAGLAEQQQQHEQEMAEQSAAAPTEATGESA